MSFRNDAKQLATARAGIERLCRGETCTGVELFGEAARSPRWGYLLLRRMRDLGLVFASRGPGMSYQYRAEPGLLPYHGDDVALTGLLWPSLSPVVPAVRPTVDDPDGELTFARHESAPPSPDEPEEEEEEQLPLALGTPRAGAPAATAAEGEPTIREMVTATLRLAAACAEALGQMNTQIAEIKTRLCELEKVWS